MNLLEVAGLIGDLLSLVGLGLGLPLFLIGAVMHSTDKKMIATEVVATNDVHTPQVRWYAAGDFYERAMQPQEQDYFEDQEYCVGFIKPRHPEIMRLEPQRQITKICRVMGTTFVAIGLIGFIASLLPLFSR